MDRRSFLTSAAAGLAAPAMVHAQGNWPNRPLRLIVPWPLGGSVDGVGAARYAVALRRAKLVAVTAFLAGSNAISMPGKYGDPRPIALAI